MVEAGCDEKLVSELLEFFNTFDKDRSRRLDIKEFRKMLGVGIPKHWFDRLVHLFDGNGDKEICFREFVYTIAKFAPPDGRCSGAAYFAWKLFDLDGSNSISREELIAVVDTADFGIHNSRSKLMAKTEKLLNQFDTDGNAELEFEEFIELHKAMHRVFSPAFELFSRLEKYILPAYVLMSSLKAEGKTQETFADIAPHGRVSEVRGVLTDSAVKVLEERGVTVSKLGVAKAKLRAAVMLGATKGGPTDKNDGAGGGRETNAQRMALPEDEDWRYVRGDLGRGEPAGEHRDATRADGGRALTPPPSRERGLSGHRDRDRDEERRRRKKKEKRKKKTSSSRGRELRLPGVPDRTPERREGRERRRGSLDDVEGREKGKERRRRRSRERDGKERREDRRRGSM